MPSRKYGPRMKGIGKFGSWLAGKLIDSDMITQECANMLKIARSNVGAHIREINKPSFPDVVAYCYYLGGDPEDIWKLVEEDWKGIHVRGKSNCWFSSKEG